VEDVRKRVLDNINQDKIVETLMDLISMPGEPDFTKPQNEWEMARLDYVEHRCKEIGLDTIRCGEVPNGRFQAILGFLRGKERKVKIAHNAHMDTHPPMDYRLYSPLHVPKAPIRHPNCPALIDGKVYGMGAGDSLSATSVFLGAAAAIKKSSVQLKYDALGVFNPGEMECGKGAQVAADWMKANNVIPEFMVTGEPNGYDIAIAQNNVIGFEIEINGFAGFSVSIDHQRTTPQYCNAFDRMIEVAQDLKAMVAEEPRFQFKHSLKTGGDNPLPMDVHMWFGPSYAGSRFWGIGHAMAPYEPLPPGEKHRHVTNNRGGYGIHIVPEIAKLRFEFVIPPRERKSDEVYTFDPPPGLSRRELEDLITKRLEKLWREKPCGCTYEPLRTVREWGGPYIISPDEPHVQLFKKSVKAAIGREPNCTALIATCSEATTFAETLDVFPFISYSSMDLHQYHRPDEHVSVDNLINSARVYASAILDFCEVV